MEEERGGGMFFFFYLFIYNYTTGKKWLQSFASDISRTAPSVRSAARAALSYV